MDAYTACAIAEGFSGEEHTEAETIEAWQFLIDTGLAWSLQGWYGRNAAAMIEAGACHATPPATLCPNCQYYAGEADYNGLCLKCENARADKGAD